MRRAGVKRRAGAAAGPSAQPLLRPTASALGAPVRPRRQGTLGRSASPWLRQAWAQSLCGRDTGAERLGQHDSVSS